MLSKTKIKFIRSLEQKKFRKQENAFIAEGPKCVGDLLREDFKARMIVATSEWQCPITLSDDVEFIEVTEAELSKTSLLQHPQYVLGVFEIPTSASMASDVKKELILALDNVQDPGNMGTIIRTADWFGIKSIICSQGSADAYNPKVVQATMGSIARIHIQYVEDMTRYLSLLPSDIPIYGALLDGENIYSTSLSKNGVIIMGNEGNGISENVRKCLTHKILIPQYPLDHPTAESLNVSIATAVILSEFRRR